jgi:hypothetical protein
MLDPGGSGDLPIAIKLSINRNLSGLHTIIVLKVNQVQINLHPDSG